METIMALAVILQRYDDIRVEKAGLQKTLSELSKVDTPEAETLRAQIAIKLDALDARCAQTMLEEFEVRSKLPGYGFTVKAQEES